MDGLPIWAKVGDLDISDEKFEEIERAERDGLSFSADFQPHDPERLLRDAEFRRIIFYAGTGSGIV